MKNVIISILLLSALVSYFSFFGDMTPYQFPQKQGWAFFGGTTGNALPGKGEAGEAEVFSLEQSEKKNATPLQTKEAFPISVSVEQKPHQTPTWEYVLVGVGLTLTVEVIGLCIVAIVLWQKSRK